jgi:hypothetical protein
MAVALSRLA